jgi:hypothetical protein
VLHVAQEPAVAMLRVLRWRHLQEELCKRLPLLLLKQLAGNMQTQDAASGLLQSTFGALRCYL